MNKRQNRSHYRFAAAALAAAAVLFAGCGGSVKSEENPETEGASSADHSEAVSEESAVSSSSLMEEESRVVALAVADEKPSERWDDELAVFEECAKDQNFRLLVVDAEEDAAKQAEKCSELLNSGNVDAMILQPVDPEQASGIVSSAHDVGVPVIAYEQMIQDEAVDYYVCAKADPEDENEPRRNLARAAGTLAGMAARGDYPMTGDMTVEGSWTEVTVGRGTVNTFVVADSAGSDRSERS